MSSDRRNDPPVADTVPGLARVALSSLWHTTEWAVGSYAKAGLRLAQAATSVDAATKLADDVQHVVRDALGLNDLEERVKDAVPDGPMTDAVASAMSRVPSRRSPASEPESPDDQLLRRGEELMKRSRDVYDHEDAHPAYSRILDELAPDEARILRLLFEDGPQPAVDVRTGGPIGLVSSELIAPGLSMIGARAGLRYVDRVPAYLNNLYRVGMVWFSRETLHDSHRYQVIEAQPDVLAAAKSVRFAKIIRRSIHLTPFGEDFCKASLGLHARAGGVFPVHQSPKDEESGSPPAL
ncbi:MAG: hypothetical protein QOG62_2214 [Thermoleophilaceae bacterium]|jgi:hypothetical protein|nr:hypothetical protein [Thermoleophilaceae bacterium]